MMRRALIALRFWRDPYLRHTWRSAWRTAGRFT